MNLRYSLRRSSLQRLLRVVVERSFSAQVQGMAVPSTGLRWPILLAPTFNDQLDDLSNATTAITMGFVAAVIVDGVRILEDGPNRTPEVARSRDEMVFSANVEVVFDVSVFASLPAAAASVNTGGVPPSTPVRARLHYLMSLKQPGIAPPPTAPPPPTPDPSIPRGPAPSSLALRLSPVWRASELSVAGSPYFSIDELAPSLRDRPPPWLIGMNQALSTLYLGALLPPMNLVSVMALSGQPDNLARIAFDHVAFVRGDEVQFGIVLSCMDLLQNFRPQQLLPLGVRDASIATFLREEPMLAPGEDCAVALGADAFECFCYPFLAGAEAAFLARLDTISREVSASAGTSIRVRQDYASPAPLVVSPDGSISIEMRFELDGACALPGVDFLSSSSIELGVKVTARGRLANVGFLAMYIELELEADFNLWDLSACALEIVAQTGVIPSLALVPGYLRTMDDQDQRLEGQVAAQIVAGFQAIQPDPIPPGRLVPYAANSRAFRLGADHAMLSLPIPVLLDMIAGFALDPNSIRAETSEQRFRVGGSLIEFDTTGAGRASAPIVEVVRDEFALSFEADCSTRRYAPLAFSARSTQPGFLISQIVVVSPTWLSLFTDRLLRWVPTPDGSPVPVPDQRALVFRCEFTSAAAVEVVLGRVSSPADRALVVVVGSNRLPVVVRWPDPLRRLRTQTPEDIERARAVCRLGPVSTPWELLRRPRELEVFPEIQPYWGGDFDEGRLDPREVLLGAAQPWEAAASDALAPGSSGPSVFTALMRSMTERAT